MPAKSKSQQRLFSMALAVRKGELARNKVWKSVLDIVDSDMTDKEIEDFTVLKENMTPLFEYLVKGGYMRICEKFDHDTIDIQTVINKTLFTKKASAGIDDIMAFMRDLSDAARSENIEKPFLYSSGSTYFKIKYALNDTIMEICDSGRYDSISYNIKGGSKKLIIKYNGSIFAETGAGSIGRVNTESQETATCVVFNSVVKELKNNPEFKYDYEFIKDCIKDISEDFDSEWVESFYKQIQGIMGYLVDVCHCDPTQYKLERYGGSKKFNDWKLSKTYQKFIQKYTKCFKDSQKDNWDPSDIILFRVDQESNIESNFTAWMEGLNNEIAAAEAKDKLKKTYYTTKDIIFKGISLKKIGRKKKPEVDIYNIGQDSKVNVNGFKIGSITNKSINLYVTGKFNFGNILDPNISSDKENEVKLCMRTFGSGQVGVDVCIAQSGEPSLGKCPVNVWQNILGEYGLTQNIKKSVQLFSDLLENNSQEQIIEDLESMIKGAIKNGPNCLPFILLH